MAEIHTPVTFTTTTDIPNCPAKLTLNSPEWNVHITWECELVQGHRHTRHKFSAKTPDGEIIEVFWRKEK